MVKCIIFLFLSHIAYIKKRCTLLCGLRIFKKKNIWCARVCFSLSCMNKEMFSHCWDFFYELNRKQSFHSHKIIIYCFLVLFLCFRLLPHTMFEFKAQWTSLFRKIFFGCHNFCAFCFVIWNMSCFLFCFLLCQW